VKYGTTGVLYEYEQGTGRIAALKFRLPVKGRALRFALPVQWRRFQRVLEVPQIRRWDDEDCVYRVPWHNIWDWVMSQLLCTRPRLWICRRFLLCPRQRAAHQKDRDVLPAGQLSPDEIPAAR
jgi:hypothetical protein